MAVNFVQSTQVLNINGQNFYTPDYVVGTVSGVTRNISCVNSEIVGAEWMMPQVAAGLPGNPVAFEYAVAPDNIKPTPSAVKVLVVKEIGNGGINVYKLAIADSDYTGTTNQFGTLCDGLGGALANMPTVTIPFPIIQDAPVTTSSIGTNTFVFPFPANPNALLYSIPQAWFNGVTPGTPYAPSGITTAALFVTWANTNWSTYGTWSSTGDIVQLASLTGSGVYVTAAGLIVSLAPAAWCLNFTTLYPAGEINANALNAGGTGYAVGDILTINGGTTLAQIQVATLSTTAIATYTVLTYGAGYSTGTGIATTAVTGSGSGATIDITTVRSSGAVTVNGVGFGSATPTGTFGAFTLSNTFASLSQLITSMRPFFESGATFTIGGTNNYKITVTTVQPTPKIYNATSVIVTAGAGAC